MELTAESFSMQAIALNQLMDSPHLYVEARVVLALIKATLHSLST